MADRATGTDPLFDVAALFVSDHQLRVAFAVAVATGLAQAGVESYAVDLRGGRIGRLIVNGAAIDEGSSLGLENLARMLATLAPTDWNFKATEYFRALVPVALGRARQPWSQVESKVFPRLRTAYGPEEIGSYISLERVEYLHAVVAFDEPQTWEFLDVSALSDWSKSVEEVARVAWENMRKSPASLDVKVDGFFGFSSENVSAWALHLDQIAPQFGIDLTHGALVTVPCASNLLVLTDFSTLQRIDMFFEFTADCFREHAYPLSKHGWWWFQGKLWPMTDNAPGLPPLLVRLFKSMHARTKVC